MGPSCTFPPGLPARGALLAARPVHSYRGIVLNGRAAADLLVAPDGAADVSQAAAFLRLWLPEADVPDALAWPGAWSVDRDDVLLLAMHGPELTGVLFGSAPQAASDLAGHLTLLAVHGDYRRRGVGRLLVRRFASIAAEAGTPRLWVDALEGDRERELVSYYCSLGWSDRTGWSQGLTDHRDEQLFATPRSVLAATEVGANGAGRHPSTDRPVRSLG